MSQSDSRVLETVLAGPYLNIIPTEASFSVDDEVCCRTYYHQSYPLMFTARAALIVSCFCVLNNVMTGAVMLRSRSQCGNSPKSSGGGVSS